MPWRYKLLKNQSTPVLTSYIIIIWDLPQKEVKDKTMATNACKVNINFVLHNASMKRYQMSKKYNSQKNVAVYRNLTVIPKKRTSPLGTRDAAG